MQHGRPTTSSSQIPSRPGTSSSPVNPVTPRTWQAMMNERGNGNFRSYTLKTRQSTIVNDFNSPEVIIFQTAAVTLFNNDLYNQEKGLPADIPPSSPYQPLSARYVYLILIHALPVDANF